ncbi:FGGY family carbohydrate kinase [Pararhizobium antarcticum]|uniref:Glycerol kinase n=1 Tax=Pararhizobium antarcticum TaxID=1798805 RepID=A0A657LSB6_9HYPH|nr:FGGY-family carbohydrate kinase [Pararhizobium antarcticum]OJF95608.1 glycerol kinase [Pararhizobium antarcticum]OJF99705.1 glycerol kinase [Rhizobium sp. 58]
MTTAILAIDQGTTNSKAVLVSTTGEILSRGASPVGLALPQPGWVEQSPERIWASVQEAMSACLSQAPTVEILGIAISNQRESVTIWDAETGKSLGPVISWQCRRTAPVCAELNAAGHSPMVLGLTGLPIDPMFPAPKMKWLLDRAPAGRPVRLGTIDSWLIHCLTDGAVHACDASNAARSQLYDLNRQTWSDALCDLFGVPKSALPKVCDSAALFGVTRNVLGLADGTPIAAAVGDSHAALFGHGAFNPGDGKVTFGTGSSIMTTLPRFIAPELGITTTIAWSIDGKPTYAFEGNILVSAAALPWMVEILGLPDVQALVDLAATAGPAGPGFVPAFVGLGAPHWHADARALFSGITFNTTRAQMARAVTDSMAFQVHDVFKAMSAQSPTPLGRLYADGGPSQNTFLMQCVADTLGHEIFQCDAPEASALGAAYLAGLCLGVWPDLVAIAALPRARTAVPPRPTDAGARLEVWQDAIFRSTLPTTSTMGE